MVPVGAALQGGSEVTCARLPLVGVSSSLIYSVGAVVFSYSDIPKLMMALVHCKTDCFLSDPHGLQHPPLSLAPGEDLSSERPFRVAQRHKLSIQVLKSEDNAVDQGHVFEIDIETV